MQPPATRPEAGTGGCAFCNPSPAMQKIHINIGSNLGDRRRNIMRAVTALARRLAPCRIMLSSYMESRPWGFESPNAFVNLGILVEKAVPTPLEALAGIIADVEREVGGGAPHRNADGSYRDRPVDVDVIAIGDTVSDSPQLTLPHPRMHLRTFVLEPVAELDPAWRHPATGMTAREMLEKLAGEAKK